MSTRLITQVADHALAVALIGEASPLVEEIGRYCQRQGFQVQRFSWSQAKNLATAKQDTHWYKVILVAELKPDWPSKAFASGLGYWQSLPEAQRLALVTFPTLIESAMPEYQAWTKLSQQLKPVLTQLAEIPASLFLGQDVITGESWVPLAVMKSAQAHNQLYNPAVTLTPQRYQDFWQQVKPQFFNPRRQTTLYQGQKYQTEAILREYQRQAQVAPALRRLTLTSLPASVSELPVAIDQLVTNNSAALPDLLRPLIQPGPGAEAAATTLPKPALRRPAPVVRPAPPSSTPKQPAPAKTMAPTAVTTPPLAPTEPITTDQELVEKVQAVFSEKRSHEKLDSVKEIAQAKTRATGKKRHRQWLFYTAVSFVGLGSFLIAAVGFYFVSAFFLRLSIWSTLQPFEQENPTVEPPSAAFVKQSALLSTQADLYASVIPAMLLGSVPTWTEIAQHMVTVHGEQATFSQALGENVVAVVNPNALVAATSLNIGQRYQVVSQLLAVLDQVELDTIPAAKQQLLKGYQRWLNAHASELVAYQRLQPVLSQMVGSQQKRKYAIVFQNDQELRPTGGFIQSVSLVTFANGQLIDSNTYGVYTLDNQLKAQVTPPAEVSQLLGEEFWFLRDSNWNPDFPQAAENMQWFIEHETNQKLDGVMTLTGPTMAALLSVIGPIELPEYNEVITDRNLTERLEFHSEVQLTNQENAKEYTELLMQRVLQKIQTLTPDKGQRLVHVLQSQLDQKNMLIYLKDSGEQSTIQALGWSGKLLVPDCPGQLAGTGTCVVDTLAVVDANIGVNKANYHLQRSEAHRITLSETKASHTHTLTFNNTSQTNAWPQGTYHAYTRFYLPADAEVQAVKINDQLLDPKQMQTSTDDVFSVVGVVSQTPIQQQTTLTLTYTTPLPQPTKLAYAFFYQKQAGVPLALSGVELTHSPALTPKLIAPQAQVQLGTISFSELDDDHVFVGVSF